MSEIGLHGADGFGRIRASPCLTSLRGLSVYPSKRRDRASLEGEKEHGRQRARTSRRTDPSLGNAERRRDPDRSGAPRPARACPHRENDPGTRHRPFAHGRKRPGARLACGARTQFRSCVRRAECLPGRDQRDPAEPWGRGELRRLFLGARRARGRHAACRNARPPGLPVRTRGGLRSPQPVLGRGRRTRVFAGA